jgi:branched-chain amino acid transport system ATP-binding protein
MASFILKLDALEVAYEGIISALRGVSLEAREGDVVALLGANGAGKTTTLKAISGLLTAERGTVTAGTISYRGQPTAALSPYDLTRQGVVQVLEGRHCFPRLTVDENLRTGGFVLRRSRRELEQGVERVLAHFPRLRARFKAQAGYLSGGEQQMLAIGRALMAEPRLVLLDEPSMGLAPLMVEEIFAIVKQLNREEGVSFLLAEQNATAALGLANWGYVLENGRVAASGSARELSSRDDVKAFYLGKRAAPGSLRRPRENRATLRVPAEGVDSAGDR